MAHEKERKLLEKFQDYWNERTTVFVLAYDIDDFLSTLPEEKEEKACEKCESCRYKMLGLSENPCDTCTIDRLNYQEQV